MRKTNLMIGDSTAEKLKEIGTAIPSSNNTFNERRDKDQELRRDWAHGKRCMWSDYANFKSNIGGIKKL